MRKEVLALLKPRGAARGAEPLPGGGREGRGWGQERGPRKGAESEPEYGAWWEAKRGDRPKGLTGAPIPQVFYPKDSYSHPVQLDLLFRQVRSSPPLLPQCTPQGNGYID